MTSLPAGLEQAFSVAAGELGMCCAAWLYVKEVADAGGAPLVRSLRDQLGRSYPVLDAVAERWLEGARDPGVNAASLDGPLKGASEVVVVGLEAYFLDALVSRHPAVRFSLLTHAPFEVDWDRVLSNYGGRVRPVDLDGFQSWAGPTSALVTFAYGIHGASTHVLPAWLRVIGEDTRTQFRTLLAWDILKAPMFVYPRWLVEVNVEGFTHLV